MPHRLPMIILGLVLLCCGQAFGRDNAPGRAADVAPAEPVVLLVDWHADLLSEIVISPVLQADGRRLAYISTWQILNPERIGSDDEERDWQVIHLGTAFKDEHGNLHIDARGSSLAGPMAQQWLPDSFRIHESGQVAVLDDAEQAATGRVRSVQREGVRDFLGLRFHLMRAQMRWRGVL
ncbi:MAG: hypothetical protein EA402_07295 [Planctomycetota bacterium]|nr:MAG: hypothetical protein EA402_07295 [Planctomycetota bacterium]